MELLKLAPYLILALGAVLSLLFVRGGAPGRTRPIAAFTGIVLIATMVMVAMRWHEGRGPVLVETYMNGGIRVDNFALFFTMVVSGCGLFTLLPLNRYLQQEGIEHGEVYSLLLFACLGMVLLAAGNDLLVLFVGVEIMSLSIYALVAARRHDRLATEAGLKYVLLGGLSSAIMLYGIALLYGAAGSTNLHQISVTAAQLGQRAALPAMAPLMMLGTMLLLGGLAFKVAAFPFHVWIPDVYEGAGTPITGFMATAVKAASFALLVRVFGVAIGDLGHVLHNVLWWVAVLSMFTGNVMALVQQNVKRMLAYSSIAHTGYLLVGLVVMEQHDASGGVAMLVYLAAYAMTSLGAFACLGVLGGQGDRLLTLDDLAGKGREHPWLTGALVLCMLSLVGFPLTAGFYGKYLLFASALRAGQVWLVVFGILNSILSVWYYLRVIVILTMDTPTPSHTVALPNRPSAAAGALLAAVAVVWAGVGTMNLLWILPGAQPLLVWAKLSMASLF